MKNGHCSNIYEKREMELEDRVRLATSNLGKVCASTNALFRMLEWFYSQVSNLTAHKR